jgi:hypothetical protein
MATAKRSAATSGAEPLPSVLKELPSFLRGPAKFAHGLLFHHSQFRTLFALILLAEFVLGCIIIQKVACQLRSAKEIASSGRVRLSY